MAQEIELKLEIPASATRKATSPAWLRELACGAVKRETLTSVYFDTDKLKLRDHGVALRVRHIGKKRLQTIKVIQKGGRGALGRGEWEGEIVGSKPDLALAKGTALAPLMTKKLHRKLRPVFETVVERVTLSVHSGESDVEIAVDRGYIRAGRAREPINEIELELKRGRPGDLMHVAERVVQSLPAAYGPRSKQDRGYALVAGKATSAVPAAGIALNRGSSTATAFQVIALACLDHALANARSIRAGDAEGVHQMRVGLRRLRAALSLFTPLTVGPESETLKAELKWLTEQLGPAREFDVFVREGIDPLRNEAPMAEITALTADIKRKRDRGFRRAKAAIDNERYRNLGIKMALWIANGEWARTNDKMIAALRDRPAALFAAETLGKRLRKIVKKARRVDQLEPPQRHKLRIAVKKLRYAKEFFSTLSDDDRWGNRSVGKQLKSLQAALGRLNDIEMHKRIGQEMVNDKRSPQQAGEALAIGFVTGHEQTEIASSITAVMKCARRLARAAPC